MISWDEAKIFWDYLEFYPESDEEGYDGEHDGGIKGIKNDAPEEAKEAFKNFIEAQENGVRL